MSLDPWALFASFVFSSIGLALVVYGKRAARLPPALVGLVLLVYPYFVGRAWLIVAIGTALLGVLWLVRRA
jgi:predicted cobalt transporter CbtA